jgi:rod shape determining protein RodA
MAPLAIPSALLAVMGVVTLRAIAPLGTQVASMWWKQLVWLGIGLPLAVGAATLSAERLKRAAYPSLGIVVATLAVLPWFGTSFGGARRWLSLGPVTVQPAELAKVVIVLALARFVGQVSQGSPRSIRDYLLPLGLLCVVVIPVFAQPNTAALVILVVAAAAVLVTVPWPRWVIPTFTAACLAAATAAWFWLLPAYQLARITSFLHPNDPLGANYQSNELRLTIGTGGLLGRGTGSWVHAAPYPFWDAPMDAPFAVWAHERGLVGSLALLGLHAMLVLVGAWIALRARDRFDRSLAIGLTAYWFLQVFLSAGSNLGLAPTLGVALPLCSYGGSNVVASLVALGLLVGVALRTKEPAPDALVETP